LRSAKYLEQFLQERGHDSKLIEKVKRLVTRHEVGGDEESNLIKDADSISFFECNVPIYIQRNGIEKARFKIKYMFDRVTSNKAKGIIKNIKYSDPKIDQLVKELLNQ
jgi:hypothetical protein